MIQQKIYFTDTTYNRIYEDGYLGNANIIFEKALDREEIFNIGKQSHFYIVDEDLKQRIDKAIKFIEDGDLLYLSSKCSVIYRDNIEVVAINDRLIELLDILKGSDEE